MPLASTPPHSAATPLSPVGVAFKDQVSAQIFSLLLQSCQRAKLLITSRYPVPNADAHLHRVNLGPLSAAETRKLILRHEGLNREPSENLKLIERAIGGHPRTLEYLDALLRNGTAKLSAVQARLNKFAQEESISLTSSAPFEDRLRDSIRLAAADAMLAELIRVVGQNPADLELLWQSSVFPFAVPMEALAFNPALPKAFIDSSLLVAPIRRLAASSLLTPLDDNQIYVHRWTAESLKPLMSSATYQACCLHAAQYLKLRPVEGLRQWVTDLTEAVRLFLSAQSFDEAASSAESLVLRLQPLGQTILWTELAREVGDALPERHDYKSRFVTEEGSGLLTVGLGNEALKRFTHALKLNQEKVQREPGRADYLRDLSVSYERLGDLQRALGNGEQASQFIEKSLQITERLVKQEPGRADYLRNLSISYNKLGDLQSALGNGEQARLFFEKSLDIRERLVNQEPGRADYLRDLSVSYERLGDLQSAFGNGEQARLFFEKSLDIRERLVKQEPGRADYLRDLSVSYERLGDLQSAFGNGEQARLFFEKSLAIRERLVNQEPGRADYLRDLSVSYNKLGDMQSALGNGEQARQFFERSLQIAERLVNQEPGRADYLRDLSVSYNKLGDLQRALGNGEQARQFFEKSLDIRERLVNQEPGRADYLRDLSVSYNKLGDLQSALGNGEQARQFFEKSLAISERLVNQEPSRADYLRDLSVSYSKLGDLQSALGNGEQARQFFEKSLAISERLVNQEPGRADYLRDLAFSLFLFTEAYHLQRALDILLDLQKTNRLNQTDEQWIAAAQRRLQTKSAGA